MEEEPLDTKADDDPKPLLYETECAVAMAQFINRSNMGDGHKNETSLAQQHLFPKALKIWGDKAKAAARKEMDQLHNRGTFEPVHPEQCSASELKKAQNALTFVTEKRDGTIKGRTVYDGSGTRGSTRTRTIRGAQLYLERA